MNLFDGHFTGVDCGVIKITAVDPFIRNCMGKFCAWIQYARMITSKLEKGFLRKTYLHFT